MVYANTDHAAVRLIRRHSGFWKAIGVVATATAFLVMSVLPAWAADMMTVTFIRHGESEGNASGLIDTSTPGPSLTALGQQQAQAIANKLSYNNYDAIYASTMVRTQQTSAPMAKALGLPVTVLPGLQEIEAGSFEGTPEATASQGYGLIPLVWSIGLPQYGMPQDMSKVMPGTTPTLDGYAFDARVEAALQTMYDNGDRNAAVFSHGGAIMFWTMMNVGNLSTAEKLKLMQTNPLGNTGTVVIQGNNEDGWTLVNWNGQQFTAEPTLGATIELQNRTLTRQLNAAVQQVRDAFATGNVAKVLSAIGTGMSTAAFSVQKYLRAVGTAVSTKISAAVTQAKTNLTNALSGKKTSGTATTDGTVGGTTTGGATSGAANGAAAMAAAVSITGGKSTAKRSHAGAKATESAGVTMADAKASGGDVSDPKVSDGKVAQPKSVRAGRLKVNEAGETDAGAAKTDGGKKPAKAHRAKKSKAHATAG